MNDSNPYASPQAVRDVPSTPAPNPTRWLSVRGAAAIVCYGIAAFLVTILVVAVLVKDWSEVFFCSATAVALVLMGWGIVSRRTGSALLGLIAALPLLLVFAMNILWRLTR
jgi:hypothetical protein